MAVRSNMALGRGAGRLQASAYAMLARTRKSGGLPMKLWTAIKVSALMRMYPGVHAERRCDTGVRFGAAVGRLGAHVPQPLRHQIRHRDRVGFVRTELEHVSLEAFRRLDGAVLE